MWRRAGKLLESVRAAWPLTNSTTISYRTPQIWVIQISNQWIIMDRRETSKCVMCTSWTTSTVIVMGMSTVVGSVTCSVQLLFVSAWNNKPKAVSKMLILGIYSCFTPDLCNFVTVWQSGLLDWQMYSGDNIVKMLEVSPSVSQSRIDWLTGQSQPMSVPVLTPRLNFFHSLTLCVGELI